MALDFRPWSYRYQAKRKVHLLDLGREIEATRGNAGNYRYKARFVSSTGGDLADKKHSNQEPVPVSVTSRQKSNAKALFTSLHTPFTSLDDADVKLVCWGCKSNNAGLGCPLRVE